MAATVEGPFGLRRSRNASRPTSSAPVPDEGGLPDYVLRGGIFGLASNHQSSRVVEAFGWGCVQFLGGIFAVDGRRDSIPRKNAALASPAIVLQVNMANCSWSPAMVCRPIRPGGNKAYCCF